MELNESRRARAEASSDVISKLGTERSLRHTLHTDDEVEIAYLVVCPTEYGGQIEHAADVAQAIATKSKRTVGLITRPGASAYLGELRGVEVQESLPPRRLADRGWKRLVRPLLQVSDLIGEHLVIRRTARNTRGDRLVTVLDATRYPLPRLLVPRLRRDSNRLVMFLHNPVPHFAGRAPSVRERFLHHLELSCGRRVDRVIVHGETQLAVAAALTRVPIVSVSLPGTSFGSPEIKVRPHELPSSTCAYFLCIGEVRANKGIELAIEAASYAGASLVVAGQPESEELLSSLQSHSKRTGASVLFIPRFLTPGEFSHLLMESRAVVLPYSSFGAQSGVAARASAAGCTIIASDLPALRDQLDGSDHVYYFEPGRVAGLVEAMKAAPPESATSRGYVSRAADEVWEPLSLAISGVWR